MILKICTLCILKVPEYHKMKLTLIATMVLSVIKVTFGKKNLIKKFPMLKSKRPYLIAKSVGFTLPSLSQVLAKKYGMVKMKEIIVATHI